MSPSSTNELAQRFHHAMAAVGLTQVEVAQRAGVARDVVHKAVNRGSVPRKAEVRDAVAKALNVESSWLWRGETPTRRPEDTPTPSQARAMAAAREREAEARTGGLYPDDIYVVFFEDDRGQPFVEHGHGVLVSPSTPPRLGGLAWVRFDGYDGIAKYTGLMGGEIILALRGGDEAKLPRRDITTFHGVLAQANGVVMQ